MDTTAKQNPTQRNHRVILSALLLALFVLRIPLFSIPLERDEGEYAYMGQQILQGIPPYAEAYTMKLPGAATMYAIIMASLGQTTPAIHLALALIISINSVFIFLIARHWMNPTAAIITATTFGIMAGSPDFLGTALHTTHFILLFSLPAIALLLNLHPKTDGNIELYTSEVLNIITSGFLIGLAILMKQHAFFLLFFGCIYLFLKRPQKNTWKWLGYRYLLFICGIALPLGITAVILYKAGVWNNFWLWCIVYTRSYVSVHTITDGFLQLRNTATALLSTTAIIWLSGLFGFFLMLKKLQSDRYILLALFLSLGATILPGLFFRQHYFVMIIPCLALGMGYLWHTLVTSSKYLSLRQVFATAFIIAALLTPLIIAYTFFYTHTPRINSATLYKTNRFSDAILFGDYIAQHTSSDEKILLIGNEPEIFFLAKRKGVTKFIYTYELNRPTAKQTELTAEFIQQAEESKPKYVILSTPVEEGIIGELPKENHNTFRQWSDNFLKGYQLIIIKSDMMREVITKDGVDFLLTNQRFPTIALFERIK